MDKLEAMAMLVAVVEKGSFSAASKSMSVPLATLSRKVGELEKRVGVRLLLRSTRALSLTPEGANYVVTAKRILEQVAEAEQQAVGEHLAPKGELVITAPLLFGRMHVLPVVTEFLALYPDINIRLNLSDRNLHMFDDHIDMAVRIGALPDSTLYASPIGNMRTVTCASTGLLNKYGTPTTPNDLSGFPCITLNTFMPSTHWSFRDPHGDKVTALNVMSRLEVTNGDAAVIAAIDGIGITQQLLYQVAEKVQAGLLKIILSEYELAPVPIHLLHVSKRVMPQKMRCFLDFAAPKIKARVDAITAMRVDI
ncbi:LysR family transcriptional regulator [Pseudoalteromonas xiamenensis]